jgi:hypothetical protein
MIQSEKTLYVRLSTDQPSNMEQDWPGAMQWNLSINDTLRTDNRPYGSCADYRGQIE